MGGRGDEAPGEDEAPAASWGYYVGAALVGLIIGANAGHEDYMFYFPVIALGIARGSWPIYQMGGMGQWLPFVLSGGWLLFGWRFSPSANGWIGGWLFWAGVWLAVTIVQTRLENARKPR